jgi:hypothetical protein
VIVCGDKDRSVRVYIEKNREGDRDGEETGWKVSKPKKIAKERKRWD